MLRKKGLVGSVSNEITEREIQHRDLARKGAEEGFVLLKNEHGFLPISPKQKIALYGAGAIKTIKGGTGSGDVNERDCVNIYQGMVNAGYEVTTKAWLESYESCYEQARENWKNSILAKADPEKNGMVFFETYSQIPFVVPCGEKICETQALGDGADTAIFVLSRIAGENADRHDAEGDYYISAEEKELLAQICRCYKQVLLVINTGGLVDLGFVEEFSNIDGILQFVQAGQEGGNAFANVISGKVSPSGKLADSWANSYSDYPNANYFSFKSGDIYREDYKEGIYVGYRYFDTFEVPVRYGFGFGLSYTEFDMQVTDVLKEQDKITVKVSVKNIGQMYSGKEVVQVYVSCPQGELPKEFRRLCGFAKTDELKPGESQEISVRLELGDLTSYSEEKAAWILEKGIYGIWVGNSLDASVLSASVVLDETAIVIQCKNLFERKEELVELKSDVFALSEREVQWNKLAEGLPKIQISAKDLCPEVIVYDGKMDILEGKAGEIVNSLSVDQLIAMATGDLVKGQGSELGSAGQSVPGAAAETSGVALGDPWNVASIVLADGPAGIRLIQQYQVVDGEIVKGSFLEGIEHGFFAPKKEKTGTTYYQYCTAIPVGTLLAQTWNLPLIEEIGEMIGKEMNLFEVTLWLAPGMNIHRNPLCGRNFEYYSEDPVLSGLMASAMTDGVQKNRGCGTTIKHFACNNQEDNRMGSDSVLSERTLREIYLKGFEIAVKKSQPMSIMTSYNMINGVHAANNKDLCTMAAREEWGFEGAIMTDWTTTTGSTAGECTASGCIRAGNDMVMPGDPTDHENLRKELKEGTLSLEELKRCVYHTVKVVLQSNQYE